MYFPLKHPTVISRLFPSHSFHTHNFKTPIHQTLHHLLEQCSSMTHLKQLHAQIILHRLTSENLTVGKLISFCSVSAAGDLRYAQLVFDQVHEPNKYMYNSLIRGYSNSNDTFKAMSLYYHMINSGLSPNEFTLPFVLKVCAAKTAYWEGVAVQCQAVKLGIGCQVCVQNGLINVYSVCGLVHCARNVFDEMSERSLVSWNSMIGGYSGVGCWKEAFGLFREMRGFGVEPDKYTLVNLLSVCSQSCDLDLGRYLHHFVVVSGMVVDHILRNALLDMYGKCGHLASAEMVFNQMGCKNVVSWTSMVRAYAKHGCIDVAGKFFDQMPLKNVVSWNSLISCYVREGQCREALDLFQKMLDSGVAPDEATLVFILSACSQVGDLVIGKEAHDHISKSNIALTVTLYNSLIDMYAKCGAVRTAMDIFTQIPEKNLVSWNIIISALALHGYGSEAIRIFEQMQEGGIWPDEITFIGLLSACSHSGLLDLGRFFFERMKSVYRISPEIEHYACLVDLLGRRGCLEEAITLMRGMPMKPDIVVWGAMLGACRIHGNVDLAKLILKQLLELELHGSGLYVLLANIFGEAHRWEDVKNIRKLIKDGGVIKNRAVSSIEIDGCVYEFMVDDNRHALSSSIYSILDQLTDHLKSLRYNPTALFDIEEL
ncbi:PREDICTED: pentatricopeptide repeat-containing protein At2g22410, mitochondrial-like [Fragaria vesca subsp. vesca]|uniref:pentatricopeptide repeat-containing protein At2g22410, mitochondrial-like n=1 Tax=Fragaria vesca subsp. vesca TaxID=101020 RepID=UPI0002C3753D|nr:PREDICTED: pentatricopeptide repeat-containing protein At2g22410, mitochondrial-like [Fragaria vesca subsp. vesca]